MATNKKSVHVGEIPEVQKYIEAEDRLQGMKNTYPGLFDELNELIEARNTALEEAEKVVRAKKVTCGPFVVLSSTTKFDAEKLFDAVGRDKFLEVGGTIETIPVYTVNKDRIKAALTQNLIPKEVQPAFISETTSYTVPKKLTPP